MTYQRRTVRIQTGQDYILSDREIEFLKLCCKDMPYWQIAEHLGVMPRTIDGYRNEMMDLLEVGSRVGIVLWCFASGFIKPKDIKMIRYRRAKKRSGNNKKR